LQNSRIKKVKKSLNKVAKRFGSHYYFPYLYIINKKGIIPQNQKKERNEKRKFSSTVRGSKGVNLSSINRQCNCAYPAVGTGASRKQDIPIK
jgi:hypothetical protein